MPIPMTYDQFLHDLIERGIAGVRQSYKDRPSHWLEGAVAGFEACRHKVPGQLAALLLRTGKVRLKASDRLWPERKRSIDRYWRVRSFESQVEWVCNCVSAILVNEGMPPIIPPTAYGTLNAACVLAGVPTIEELHIAGVVPT